MENNAKSKALLRWSATERKAWLDAVINDPLLPGGYCRRIIWGNKHGEVRKDRRRLEVLGAANRQPRTFKPE